MRLFKKLFERFNRIQALAFFSALIGLVVSVFSFFISMVVLNISVWFISIIISFFFTGWSVVSMLFLWLSGKVEVF